MDHAGFEKEESGLLDIDMWTKIYKNMFKWINKQQTTQFKKWQKRRDAIRGDIINDSDQKEWSLWKLKEKKRNMATQTPQLPRLKSLWDLYAAEGTEQPWLSDASTENGRG